MVQSLAIAKFWRDRDVDHLFSKQCQVVAFKQFLITFPLHFINISTEAIAEPRGVETDKNVVQPGWASAQPPPSIKKDHGTDGREGTKNASNTHTPSVPVDKIGKVSGSKSPSHHKG